MGEDALFQQAGIIRTATLAELFGTAQLLSDQPLPAGDRVGIITNAGGPGVLCADSCEFRGLRVPDLADEVKVSFAGLVPSTSTLQNPVVLLAQAGTAEYQRAITIMAASPAIDQKVEAIMSKMTLEQQRQLRERLVKEEKKTPNES